MGVRNSTIDLAKFVAALLVVAIHTALFRDVNQTLYFVFNELICRLAVPFFAICTGYYMCLKCNGKEDLWEILWRQEKKLVKLYALWTLLYFLFLIPNWIEIDYLSLPNCMGYLKSAVLTGSYFHLWYVLYVVYALPVFYLCIRYIRPSFWLWLAIVLYSINAFKYGYSSLFAEDNNIIVALSYIDKGYAIVKAQFVILPMMLCGAYLTNHGGFLKNNIAFAVIFLLLLILEASCLRRYVQIANVSYIFMILPTACFIFASLLHIETNILASQRLGKMSLVVYCVHPMFCKYINNIAPNTMTSYTVVCVLSVLVAFLWTRFRIIRKQIIQ